MVFIAQSKRESQVGHLRFRSPNNRFRFFNLGLASLLFFNNNGFQLFFFLTVLCSSLVLIDRRHVAPWISFTNVAALNYLLRSKIFVSEDGKLRAVQLILNFKTISDAFQGVGNAIRAGNQRIPRIDVSRPHFLARDDLPPIAHPFPEGIPLVIQPIQQVPLKATAAEEEVASSSSLLEEEIDKFHFGEEEPQGVQVISVSDAEEEPDRHSSVHALVPVVARLEDTLDEKEEEMALNAGSKSLRDLMKARNKISASKETNKSQPSTNLPPPPPQLPTDLRLKPIPELKKKRPNEALEEGKVGPMKGNKQQKVVKDQ